MPRPLHLQETIKKNSNLFNLLIKARDEAHRFAIRANRIAKRKNMSISIYPNPTAAILNVKFDKDLELTIYNLLGQQVLQSNSKTLDLSGLNDGTYILVTKNLENNTTTNFKIIKE